MKTKPDPLITIDKRVGSSHLRSPLKRLGLKTKLGHLEFGDVAFEGTRGLVGIELKRLMDLSSSLTTGRLAGHQAPGMMRAYPHRYIVIEGLMRPARDGLLETYSWERKRWRETKSRVTYSQLHRFVMTLEGEAGFKLRRTTSGWETAVVIADIYRWHQKTSHKSLHTYDESRENARIRGAVTQAEMVAASLPGIKWVRAHAMATRFPTVEDLTDATVEDLQSVPGVGKKLASQSWRALHTVYRRDR